MLNLDTADVDRWLAHHEPGAPRTPPGQISMDDLPSVQVALRRLTDSLERRAAQDPEALGQLLSDPAMAAALQTVLAHLTPERRLRLFSWLQEVGAGACLAQLWGDTPGSAPINSGRLVRRSLQHLHRAACLSRIFAPDRVAQLHALCEVSP